MGDGHGGTVLEIGNAEESVFPIDFGQADVLAGVCVDVSFDIIGGLVEIKIETKITYYFDGATIVVNELACDDFLSTLFVVDIIGNAREVLSGAGDEDVVVLR